MYYNIRTNFILELPRGISAPLSLGTHLFLLRSIGPSIIEGHYIGSKTN
jgi:hypothetical protein